MLWSLENRYYLEAADRRYVCFCSLISRGKRRKTTIRELFIWWVHFVRDCRFSLAMFWTWAYKVSSVSFINNHYFFTFQQSFLICNPQKCNVEEHHFSWTSRSTDVLYVSKSLRIPELCPASTPSVRCVWITIWNQRVSHLENSLPVQFVKVWVVS